MIGKKSSNLVKYIKKNQDLLYKKKRGLEFFAYLIVDLIDQLYYYFIRIR